MTKTLKSRSYRLYKYTSCIIALCVLSACGGMSTKPIDSNYGSAIELMKNKKYQDAARILEQAIITNDEHIAAYINLGIAYTELGKKEDAKNVLLIATSKAPKNAVAHNQLGIIYRQIGDFKNARKTYKKSISIDSKYSNAFLNLGILCDIYLNDLPCAISNYTKYQELGNQEDKQLSMWISDLKMRSK